mmetsp:Transcript_18918/g.47154  ORF Transcript_18918/g.47154 Transcript_18918/m.47154 type:complete len:141 (-) Transcript_18918:233-655(-)|eukprot:CAMPEP_0197575094 /NCGR_PEP_ID=MMETSP1326-20131121/611_1 /TAXON_ID=1155430 /ORGANISM="Genus nov. species nov., Strain RCC2288" /LENGTH=140 /DNA_ID=CAMNT_0043137799 /DNA_START=249 /DNA_END=671 /DNA_ORIENTATION=-
MKSSLARLATSAGLSAPAGAPVFSANLAEARARSRQFYRDVCREIPWTMKTYFLEEVTTPALFRSQLAAIWRRHAVTDHRVIDVMLFKASQELVTVLCQHFQRHHLITKFIDPKSNAIVRATAKPQSMFLSSFLEGRKTE